MKKLLSVIALLVLCAVIPFFGRTAVNASAEISLTETYTHTYGDGFTYKEGTYNDGGKQAVFLGEYKPSATSDYEFVLHSVRNGSKTTVTNVLGIARDYEQKTGRKVMLATNGDYFDFTSGANVESYVNDGIVITKGVYATKHCMGFDNQGKVVVGKLSQTQRRLMIGEGADRRLFEIDKVNAEPADGEIAIYTNAGTYNIANAGKYVVATDSTSLSQYPVWGESRRLTTGTAINSDPVTIRSQQFAIVVKGEEKAQYFYDNIAYGVKCSLVEIPDGDFAGCDWVVGGYDILVDNGVVNTNPHTDNDGSGKAPRTFMGFKEDGTAFLCVYDGRQTSHSVGISVKREAEIAKELGAKYALELDGGGSSTVILRVDDELVLRNKPSDGSMRKVSNAVLLVEKPKAVAPPDKPDDPGDDPGKDPGKEPGKEPEGPGGEVKPNGDNKDYTIYIVIGAAAGVLVIAAAVIAIVVVKRKRRAK